ncbi:MAG: hypothetical protein A2663_02155 [Candidatus Buchananbacteria bacterium RIFCSPHIGHO2_01_FULL_46_12]|uniref:GIY-YIG domain-containing protein n=2 Tax=Candidatus Buchananiibacteriota TaxID=1817903 RepID=A0A1G1Y640_9BACT|nr:MAG: hypothetical protein A2663_02155 [Candidatus Buchananbacteria bacterium RIFCSPHIGHO2_01_FULL_46_12]OGY54125.1 MAG: hypothetical protein A3B15_03300 [Candidatus Buchananbacteria bacterium RIFCSPLOWO2_01_FULL_45_31]
MSEWTLYIDKCKDNSLYTGISSNPDKRLIEHNLGRGAQWFRQHGQGQIVYTEKYQTYLEAHRRELQIKKWSRIKKDNLIKYGHPTKINLNINT